MSEAREYLDRTRTFICDVTRVVQVPLEDAGFRTTIRQDMEIGESVVINSAAEICPPDTCTVLTFHNVSPPGSPSQPEHYVVIVCPVLLTQTEGRPKMFASMDGQEVTTTSLK